MAVIGLLTRPSADASSDTVKMPKPKKETQKTKRCSSASDNKQRCPDCGRIISTKQPRQKGGSSLGFSPWGSSSTGVDSCISSGPVLPRPSAAVPLGMPDGNDRIPQHYLMNQPASPFSSYRTDKSVLSLVNSDARNFLPQLNN